MGSVPASGIGLVIRGHTRSVMRRERTGHMHIVPLSTGPAPLAGGNLSVLVRQHPADNPASTESSLRLPYR